MQVVRAVVDRQLIFFSVQEEFSVSDTVAITADQCAEERFRTVDDFFDSVMTLDDIGIIDLMIGVGGQVDEPELITVRPEINITDRTGQTRYYGGINFTLSGGTYTQAQKDYVSNYVSAVFKVVAKAVYDHEYYDLARDGTMTRKRSFEWAKTDEEKQIETVSAVFNLESAVSMCILDEICKNLDAMAFNMYVDLSPEGDGVLTLAAPWDFDFSMANTHYSTTHSYSGFYATNFSESEGVRVNAWYVLLGSIPWFEDMIRERRQLRPLPEYRGREPHSATRRCRAGL